MTPYLIRVQNSKPVLLPLHGIFALHYLLVSLDYPNKSHMYLSRQYIISLTGRGAAPDAGNRIGSRGGWRG
jgi:hypothetical protein